MDLYNYVLGTIFLVSNQEDDSNLKLNKTIIQKITYLSLPKEFRSEFYRPYLYGPYSDKVQSIVDNLIINGVINYSFKEKSYILDKNISSFKDVEVKGKIEKIIKYLDKNKLSTVDDIANVSKVFMLMESNPRITDHENLIKLIKTKSKLLNWTKLLSKKKSGIEVLIELSKELSDYVPA